jgi:hypothetical protein
VTGPADLFARLAEALEEQGRVCVYAPDSETCLVHGPTEGPDGPGKPCRVSYTVNRAELVATLRTIARKGKDVK